jgi:hypothetical protein
MKHRNIVVAVAITVPLAASCCRPVAAAARHGAPAAHAAAPIKAEPGVAKGRVTDARGRPVVGATVTLWSYSNAGRHFFGKAKTDGQGRWRAPVNGPYVYTLTAAAEVEYDEKVFRLPCNPVTEQRPQRGAHGIVQDFVLTLTGLNNELDADRTSYHQYAGAAIWANYPHAYALPAGAKVVFTLTPEGPLADGTAGKTLTLTRSGSALREGPDRGRPLTATCVLHDIPLGVYKMSAKAVVPGAPAEYPFTLRVFEGVGKGYGETGGTVTVHFPTAVDGKPGAAQIKLEHPEALEEHLKM